MSTEEKEKKLEKFEVIDLQDSYRQQENSNNNKNKRRGPFSKRKYKSLDLITLTVRSPRSTSPFDLVLEIYY